jgi:hypothetical protein
MTDGRGNQTLSRQPDGVVIIVGINDIYNGVSVETLKNNFEWMASVCQENGISCVILNVPGDGILTQDHVRKVNNVNKWLANGALDQYGAVIVDYNSWWNDPAYGNDNIHHTSLIVDDIHPTQVGYDSLSNYIYRSAKLPKLTKVVFSTKRDPAGFTGFSRPDGITINSDPYTIANDLDTLNITTFVPDSVWIKVTSSTNITGTTYSGFSHIQWFTDNNTANDSFYTRKTRYAGGSKSQINATKIILTPGDPTNGNMLIDSYLGDGTNHGLQYYAGAGAVNMILNGLTNTSPLNSATLSVYTASSSNTGISTNGRAILTAPINKIANLEINLNSKATTTGFGISTGNSTSTFEFNTTANVNKDQYTFTNWTPSQVNLNTGTLNLISLKQMGFKDASSGTAIGNTLALLPVYNMTTANVSILRGIYYNPTLTSLTNARHMGMLFVSGDNYLNAVSGTTCIGCDSAANNPYKLQVNGSIAANKDSLPLIAAGTVYQSVMIDSTTGKFHRANSPGTPTSGTYTPTETDIANIATSTSNLATYIQVGLVVHVSGSIAITATAAATTSSIDITLPVGTVLTSTTELNGTANSDTVFGYVTGQTTDHKARITFTSPVTGSVGTIRYTFSYLVTN